MKITKDTARILYLQDLQLPDTFHDVNRPRVKRIQQWKDIKSKAKDDFVDVGSLLLKDNLGDVWIWSDIHWGHKNICKYSGRPFTSVDQMNDALINNYLAVVKPDDIVIFGGDIAFLNVNKINEILDQLPGYKIHVIGNHDIHKDGSVYDLSMDEQHLCMLLDVNDPVYQYQILISHYPIEKIPSGCHNIHGHIHQHLANKWNTNVCVEHTNYAPIKLNTLLPRIKHEIQTRRYHNGNIITICK